MSKALQIAQLYFEYSNLKDLESIAKILSESVTYSSDNTGIYVGKDNILSMTESFFNGFDTLNWDIHDVKEVKDNILLFDFTLTAIKHNGETLIRDGLEHVAIFNNKIQHVEVRNK